MDNCECRINILEILLRNEDRVEYIHMTRGAEWIIVLDEIHAFPFVGDSGRPVARKLFNEREMLDIHQKCTNCGCVSWSVVLS